jgi:hypothetical protein
MDVGEWGVDFTLLSQRGQARESDWQEKLHSEEKIDCLSWWNVRRLSDIAARDEAKEMRPDAKVHGLKTGGVFAGIC